MRELLHPDWVRRLNYLGSAVGDPRHVVGLDADELLAVARATTGLDDVGEDDWPGWTETFERQVRAIDAEASLHLLGRVLTRGEVLRVLQTWLRLQAAWSTTPAVADEPVTAPVFVVGPPRTGTTILLELLSLDPQLRAPVAYEALYPLASSGSVARRLELSQAEQELWADIHPPFLAMHELASDLPCECVHFLMYDFSGPYWAMSFDAPSFTGWQLEHLDTLGRLYRLHRRMLQTFQHEAPGPGPRRWLLKSPFHVSTLPALFAEYPDALVVHTHRDPRKFLASLVSILSALRFMRSDAVDVEALAQIMQATYALFLEGTIEARRSGAVPAGRIVDSHFTDLMRDPVASLRATYDGLGLAWPAGHDAVVRAYLAAKPRAKHGEHAYALAEVGLDPDAVAAGFAAYVEHYGIEPE
ncbi:MAG TPA: sulfotransferase [Acidimicrobiales bacterium]|nr:sulfotransferase [Acidimicrobiales bacterium]